MTFDRGDILLSQQTSNWKISRSLWLAVVAFGCGCFSFIGWIWAGIVSQSRRVWIVGAGWTVPSIAVFLGLGLLSPADQEPAQPWSDIFVFVLLALVAGQVIHGALLVRPVLKAQVVRADAMDAARAQHFAQLSAQQARPSQTGPIPGTFFSGVDAGSYYAPTSDVPVPSEPTPQASYGAASSQSGGQPIDVNSASAGDLRAIFPDEAIVTSVVSARDRLGGFHDLGDLISGTGLQPHEVARYRSQLSFGPFTPRRQPPPRSGSGRVLDL